MSDWIGDIRNSWMESSCSEKLKWVLLFFRDCLEPGSCTCSGILEYDLANGNFGCRYTFDEEEEE